MARRKKKEAEATEYQTMLEAAKKEAAEAKARAAEAKAKEAEEAAAEAKAKVVEAAKREAQLRATQERATKMRELAAAEARELAAAKVRTYVVQSGDSLSKIAKEELGDASRWPEILELNKDKIKDPNLIHPGQELEMPS
jgi:nucleoid-associated protein YgaU